MNIGYVSWSYQTGSYLAFSLVCCVCVCVFLAEQSQCQQELDKVLEEISKMTFHDNKGHLENLYELTFPNCDSNGQYNVKQVCSNMKLLLGYVSYIILLMLHQESSIMEHLGSDSVAQFTK